MKTVLKIFGILIVFAVLLIGGPIGWFKYQQSAYASTAIPYIKQTLPVIAHWEIATVKSYMTAEALNATSDTDLEKLLNWFKKLGSLNSIDEPILTNIYSGIDGSGSVKILTYSVLAHFQAGDAEIMLRLTDVGSEQFKIHAFNINSNALAG